MRFRFSLRGFLISFTVLAIALGFLGHYVYRVKEQVRRHKIAIAEIQSHGFLLHAPFSEEEIEDQSFFARFARGWIDRDACTEITQCHLGCLIAREAEQILTASQGLYGWHDVQLELWKLDVPLLELLKKQPQLRRLRLSCRDIDPEAAARLGELTSIVSLTIRPSLTDAGAASLAQLPNLTSLEIDISRLSSASAGPLSRLRKLRSLSLWGQPSAPQIVKALTSNPQLIQLAFLRMKLSDDVLKELHGESSISFVAVEDCEFPDSFWSHMASLPELKELFLDYSKAINVQNMSALAHSPSLVELNFQPLLEVQFDLPGFTAPATLRLLELEGHIQLSAVKTILASAPDCVIDVRKPNVSSRNQSGTRFRSQDGVVETYDYVEHNGMPITPSPAVGPPPWKPIAK